MPNTPAVRPHLVAWEATGFTRPLDRLIYEPEPVPLSAHVDATWLSKRTVMLLGCDETTMRDVAAMLAASGVTVCIPTVDGAIPAEVDAIIDFNLVGTTYRLSDRSWQEPLRRSTLALQRVYRRWVAEPRYGHHAYV